MTDPYDEVRGMLRTGSTRYAMELERLGWTFLSQYPEDEPAEIRMIWKGTGPAPRPSANPDDWETPPGEYKLSPRPKE